MNDALQPVMAALDTLRREFGQRLDTLTAEFGMRLDAMNTKHDKLREELPDKYIPRTEFEPWAAKVAQFDEWRMNMVQEQYRQLMELQGRQDGQQNQTLRENLHEARRSSGDQTNRQFQLNMNSAGWLVALAVGLIEVFGQVIGPHIHWIP